MSKPSQRPSPVGRGVLGALVTATAVLLLTPEQTTSAAATITVTTTADELDQNGTCSLREAVLSANLDQAVDTCPAGNGADTIVVAAGTYLLGMAGADEGDARTGDLDIVGDVTITGASALLDGAGLDRVLDVHGGAVVTLTGVTVRGGYVLGDVGGGIYNAGTLVIEDSTVTANAGDLGDTGPSYGAGIGNDGALTLLRVQVVGNALGQIYPAGSGGGVFNRGTLSVRDSTVSANHAWEQGGGVWSSGTASLVGSTVSGNATGCFECASEGGGLYNKGTITVDNSTISDNLAAGGDYSPSASGGGLFTSGTGLVSSTTIAGNLATSLCDTHCFAGPAGGGVAAPAGSVTVVNSIVAANAIRQDQSEPNGGGSVTSPSACVGTVTSDGYNLVDTSIGCDYVAALTDLLGADPQLGPLADNGGPTLTRRPSPLSPAVDAGMPTTLSGGNRVCPAHDQRGAPRPQDGNDDRIAICDIGAYELEAHVQPSTDVTVDIKPGSDSNPVNLGSKVSLTVAIVSGATFDATTVDVMTVRFGPGGATSSNMSIQDVNGDRRADVILHFRVRASGIALADDRACLVGTTISGGSIHGCDAVQIVPRSHSTHSSSSMS